MERPEEELLILELFANNTLRNYGLIGYLPQGSPLSEALFPIYALSKAMSFPIKSNPILGIAEGWFFENNNSFHLDLNQETILIKGKEERLPKNTAEAHFDDIYVQASSIEKWFNVKINLNLSRLQMSITSHDRPFPFEEELARKEKAEKLSKTTQNQKTIPYNSETLLPYQWITPPSFVWQQTIQANQSSDTTNTNTSFSLQSYGDLFKTESRFTLSGTTGTNDNETKINTAQGYFQKRDPTNSLLGPLKAGRITFGDITYPDVPLIISKKRGRGITISSESNLNLPSSYSAETYNLDGDAPIGWDAELYRNGYYVDFQTIGEDGRYNFEDIDLIRGYNIFQITLYGPEGQKRTITQRVARGQKILNKGELKYDFAAGQPDADFLPFAKTARADTTPSASGHITYGIKENLTIGANIFTGKDNSSNNDDDTTNRLSAANISATLGISGVKLQGKAMAANKKRSAYELEASTQIKNTNLSASHTHYKGFNPDDRDMLSSTDISANRNFGAFSTNLSAQKKTYQEDKNETILNGTLSTNIAGINISNTATRTLSKNESQDDFKGKTSILTDLFDWRLRGGITYDLDHGVNDKVRKANLSAYKKLTKTATMRFNTAYDFPNNITTADIKYSTEREQYSLDFNLGSSGKDSYFGALTVRTGLKPDQNSQYKIVSARDGGLGAVGLRAYLDQNGNHIYNMGEKLLPNISFRSNKGLIKKETDKDGVVFVKGLAEGLTRFELEEKSLPSIYIKPYKDYIDIIPRSGATTILYMGFEQLGEIDGFVYLKTKEDKEKPYPGIELRLIDNKSGEEIQTTTSEYDGYYVFSTLPIGSYMIEALPLWDNEPPPNLHIDLTHDSFLITDQNIIFPERKGNASPSDTVLMSSIHADVHNEIEDKPLPVLTNGLDLATSEPLRGLFTHFSSLSSFESAKLTQKELWQKNPRLSNIPIYIYKISVGEQTFYRVVGAVNDYKEGRKTCDAFLKDNPKEECTLIEM